MKKVGLFHIGEFAFALSLECIVKIVQSAKLYKFPSLPMLVSGVLVNDNSLVPLIDSVCVYGAKVTQSELASSYQVLVSTEYGVVALPANLSGKIVATTKGEFLELTDDVDIIGAVGKFLFASDEYYILDVNSLAKEMTQGIWQSQPDTGGARRHQ